MLLLKGLASVGAEKENKEQELAGVQAAREGRWAARVDPTGWGRGGGQCRPFLSQGTFLPCRVC